MFSILELFVFAREGYQAAFHELIWHRFSEMNSQQKSCLYYYLNKHSNRHHEKIYFVGKLLLEDDIKLRKKAVFDLHGLAESFPEAGLVLAAFFLQHHDSENAYRWLSYIAKTSTKARVSCLYEGLRAVYVTRYLSDQDSKQHLSKLNYNEFVEVPNLAEGPKNPLQFALSIFEKELLDAKIKPYKTNILLEFCDEYIQRLKVLKADGLFGCFCFFSGDRQEYLIAKVLKYYAQAENTLGIIYLNEENARPLLRIMINAFKKEINLKLRPPTIDDSTPLLEMVDRKEQLKRYGV